MMKGAAKTTTGTQASALGRPVCSSRKLAARWVKSSKPFARSPAKAKPSSSVKALHGRGIE
jgi:hypothetical protein